MSYTGFCVIMLLVVYITSHLRGRQPVVWSGSKLLVILLTSPLRSRRRLRFCRHRCRLEGLERRR